MVVVIWPGVARLGSESGGLVLPPLFSGKQYDWVYESGVCFVGHCGGIIRVLPTDRLSTNDSLKLTGLYLNRAKMIGLSI